MENSGDRSIRDTLLGSALAGVVAVTVLSVLSTMSLGSDLVQFGVALLFGVIAAQVYESRLARAPRTTRRSRVAGDFAVKAVEKRLDEGFPFGRNRPPSVGAHPAGQVEELPVNAVVLDASGIAVVRRWRHRVHHRR